MKQIALLAVLSSAFLVGCATNQAHTGHGANLLTDASAQPGSTYELGVYVVARGDTVAKICKQFQIPVRDFRTINPELGVTHLEVGQKVRVYERLKQ
jgi:LysM repeat protein